MVEAEGKEILRSYIEVSLFNLSMWVFISPPLPSSLSLQFMFMTEVDSSRKKAVHDELARLLVQYIRQPDPVQISAVLEVIVPILQNHSINCYSHIHLFCLFADIAHLVLPGGDVEKHGPVP